MAYLKSLAPVDLALCQGATFLQSPLWGLFKSRFGWNAQGFLAEWEHPAQGAGRGTVLALIRSFSLPVLGRVFTFAYIPWGPELPQAWGLPPAPEVRQGALTELAESLRQSLPRHTAFIRIDPPWYSAEGAALEPLALPFVKAGSDVQPPDTVILDLSAPEEEILGSMKPKWRYNVRLSEKKGVEIRQSGQEELSVFYTLFQETARRDGIAIHSFEYYATLFALCLDEKSIPKTAVHHPDSEPGGFWEDPMPDLRLYIASHEGQDIAAIITLFRGSQAYYLYGASSDQKRNLMAPYGLQWKAICDAKAAGCLEYDLFGIPPREDPQHPMAGLYRFKTGFGGNSIHRMGSYDYPYRPLLARLFRKAEAVRQQLRR